MGQGGGGQDGENEGKLGLERGSVGKAKCMCVVCVTNARALGMRDASAPVHTHRSSPRRLRHTASG